MSGPREATEIQPVQLLIQVQTEIGHRLGKKPGRATSQLFTVDGFLGFWHFN